MLGAVVVKYGIECEKLKKYLCLKFVIQIGLCKVVNLMSTGVSE